MPYRRWLAVVLFSCLITSAQSQVRGGRGTGLSTGSVHVHVVFADDRKAGANLQVRLMQGSSGTPVGTTYTNDMGKADFRNVTVGEYHVEVSGEGIESTESELFEVDARQVTQAEYVTVRHAATADAKAVASQSATVSASGLGAPEKARKQLDQANEAIAKREWKRAVELLNKAISIYPQFALAYNNLAVVYANLNDVAHEQQALEKAVALDEHFAPACQNLARLYLRQKEFSQAETLLGKALRADPNNGQNLTLMADVQYMLRNYDAAIATAQKVHALPDQHPATAHYIAAMAYQQQSRPQEAQAELQVFLQEEPTGPRADRVRADIAKLQGSKQVVSANSQ
jgi:tetratricopeptide (TPR) repeat protein